MTSTARIHSVETFGTVDGPGIRYVIFFQGCPLQCKYCHNRDTWDARTGEEITLDAVISDVKKYLRFYQSSGGGLTASGGEPTVQADFVTQLFAAIKGLGLNTALDTSGYVPEAGLDDLLAVTDLVLLDIKAVDPQEHQKLTGVTNERILKFADLLKEINKPVWVRHVLLPNVNDDSEHLTALANLVKSYPNTVKIELLGFHKLGVHKWEACGDTDPLNQVPAATLEVVDKARQFLRAQGLTIV